MLNTIGEKRLSGRPRSRVMMIGAKRLDLRVAARASSFRSKAGYSLGQRPGFSATGEENLPLILLFAHRPLFADESPRLVVIGNAAFKLGILHSVKDLLE